MKKKNYKDDFELLYLRHDYLERTEKLNGDYYKEFENIINITNNIMFRKHSKTFYKVGFNEDDLRTVTAMYALAYMDLYSIRNNKSEKNKFLRSFRKRNNADPTKEDYRKAEINHMINFLRQRLVHCVTVCERKSRSIVCGRDRSALYAFTENSAEADPMLIMGSHNKYGYRKVTAKEYKEVTKKAKELGDSQLVDKDGYKIFVIENITSGMAKEEYLNLILDQNSDILKNPEQAILDRENERMMKCYKDRFYNLPNEEKKKVLKDFIKKNKNNDHYKKQVRLARKILRNKDLMVL